MSEVPTPQEGDVPGNPFRELPLKFHPYEGKEEGDNEYIVGIFVVGERKVPRTLEMVCVTRKRGSGDRWIPLPEREIPARIKAAHEKDGATVPALALCYTYLRKVGKTPTDASRQRYADLNGSIHRDCDATRTASASG